MYYSGARCSAHTDPLSGRARLRLCGLAVCCRILAGDKLSGSHFTELVRILVEDGFFFFYYQWDWCQFEKRVRLRLFGSGAHSLSNNHSGTSASSRHACHIYRAHQRAQREREIKGARERESFPFVSFFSLVVCEDKPVTSVQPQRAPRFSHLIYSQLHFHDILNLKPFHLSPRSIMLTTIHWLSEWIFTHSRSVL